MSFWRTSNRIPATGNLIFAFAAIALPANADTRLICENPGREYLVVYEPGTEFLTLNPDSDKTRYRVLIDNNDDATHIVTAATFDGGPTAQLHLRPYLKIEFWSDGQLFQTDACYLAK